MAQRWFAGRYGGRVAGRSGVLVGVLSSVMIAGAAIVAGGGAAVAGPVGGAPAAPVTDSQGDQQVVVDPADGLPAAGGSITVSGRGFDPEKTLWIAICQRGDKERKTCLGGELPNVNKTPGFVVVTNDPEQAPAGVTVVPFGTDGTFGATLKVAAAADTFADCVQRKCDLLVMSAEDPKKPINKVSLAFEAAPPTLSTSSSAVPSTPETTPTTSAPPTTAEPTTEPTSAEPTVEPTSAEPTAEPTSTAPVPTTVQVDSMLLSSVAQGAENIFVFSGFQPGEKVTVTLSGNPPTELPAVTADPNGEVRFAWRVPADFPPGGYSMRVEGPESLRVGLANVTVTARPVASSSASPSSTATAGESAASPSETPSASASAAETSVTESSVVQSRTPESAAPSTDVSTSVPPQSSSNSTGIPPWVWVVLGVGVLVGLAVLIAAMTKRRRDEADDEYARREQELSAAAAVFGADPNAGVNPTVAADPNLPGGPGAAAPTVAMNGPGSGAELYDEHPDRPVLFSHRHADDAGNPAEAFTQALPTQPQGFERPGVAPNHTGAPAPNGPGGWIEPDAADGSAHGSADTSAADGGPGTAQFDPFAQDDDGSGPGTAQFDPFADDPDSPPRRQ